MRCQVLPVERVFNGTDGVIQYALLDDCSAVADLAAVTRVTIKVGTVTVDSDVVGSSVIWWDEQITYRGQAIDVVTARLGGQGITAGEYLGGRLTVYDPVNPNGIVWSDALHIMVS